MIYKVQFCKAWKGTWKFDTTDDYWAWNKAWRMIKEHTQVVNVEIDSIYELDENDRQIRKLPEYDECKRISVKKEQEEREKRKEILYIVYFTDGTRSEPFAVKNILQETNPKKITQKSFAEETAKQKFTKNIETVEKILLNERAIYKAYFSDGTCSGAYVTEISVNNISAKEMALYKLKQHAEYNGLDVNKLKVVKIEELNEDNNFIPNREFVERNKKRIINKLQARKNRLIENAGL
jgi:hypothetical protein